MRSIVWRRYQYGADVHTVILNLLLRGRIQGKGGTGGREAPHSTMPR